MNCKSYLELTVIEQVNLIGKAIHLLQNSEDTFRLLSSHVRQCENNGMLDNVKILPVNTQELKE